MEAEWLKIKSALRSAPLSSIATWGLILGLVLGFLVPALVGHFQTPPPLPTLDANAQAYVLVLKGLKVGRYSQAQAIFDEAYSAANDSELRYVANYCSRSCGLAIESGVQSHEEASSVEGGAKAFLHGFTAPLSSISAVSLLFQRWFGDLDKNCNHSHPTVIP